VRRCLECAGRRIAFERARAAVAYDEPVRTVVGAWKERGLRRLAAWAAAVIVDTLPRPAVDSLVFVPGDHGRRLVRGHHAGEELARELARLWALPLEPLLARGPGSRRQRGLSQAERRRNVAGAFSCAVEIRGSVCLVDDVYTTGATVQSAASVLRRGGAQRVEVVTFARAIRIR
jgi:ComF family protein